MLQSEIFEARIFGASYIAIPEIVAVPFISKDQKRVLVKATFEDKSIEFHAAILKREGRYNIIFGKRNQKALGIFPNDYFRLQFLEDTSLYGVEMPEELAAVFKHEDEALTIFNSFTDGKKKPHLQHKKI